MMEVTRTIQVEWALLAKESLLVSRDKPMPKKKVKSIVLVISYDSSSFMIPTVWSLRCV